MKRMTAVLLVIILFISLACSSSGNNGSMDLPVEVDPEQVSQAATQAALAAEQASNAATQAAASGQAATAVSSVEIENSIATAQALGANYSIEDLKQLFSSVQLDAESGSMVLTITDTQLNQAVQMGNSVNDQSGVEREQVIEGLLIQFTGGNIILSGSVVVSDGKADLVVTFKPYVQDGVLVIEVVEATLAGARVPAPVLKSAETIINATLADAVNSTPPSVVLQDIIMGEGTLTAILVSSV